MAEYYFSYGRYGEAMSQVMLALKDPNIDDIMKERLEEKRDVLKSWLDNGH
jgi:hypothetical protein